VTPDRQDARKRAGKGASKPENAPDASAPAKAGLPARMAAARLLAAIVDRHTPLDGLTDEKGGNPAYLALDERDRMLVRAILNAALRHRRTIEALISARLERPLPAKAHALSHLLHVGAAQILFLDVPDSAAVDLAVTHAGADPRTARFSGLVNGVLREIARRKERALPAVLAKTREAPDWLIDRLESAYGPETAQHILEAHRREPSTDFTVKSDPELWAERLGGVVLPTGSVRVGRLAGPVSRMPGFEDGEWWVQDTAASFPARLFGDISGRRVADLCAAPGGKSAQLALAGARVTAVEKSANRARRLQGESRPAAARSGNRLSDLFDLDPAEPFDAVLLDAPCSSTGTIRRHPDVAWTKTPQDIDRLAELQYRMADFAIGLVRPGGRIVFSNCSLDPAEGEAVVARLLTERTDVEIDPITAEDLPGIAEFVTQEGFLRTTPAGMAHAQPELSGLDGFFAARLRRLA
jgi:16S rRNA (cytosine967-C5)-methyltransferase